jgi:hypothetical protein
MGTGNFGDIIQSVSELQLLGTSGDIVGCMEAEACNFDSEATINFVKLLQESTNCLKFILFPTHNHLLNKK